MSPSDPADAKFPPRWPGRSYALAAVGIGGLLVLGFVLYGAFAPARNASVVAACRGALPVAEQLAPLARGEMAALQVARAPAPLPALAFNDPTGTPTTLDAFRGRVVLLNLWATWCAPCRKEMPALAALQRELGSDRFSVIAINIDTRAVERARAFLGEVGATSLAFYADPSARIFQDLKAAGKAFGMPTTILIDPAGCELASLAGAAEWASEEAKAVVRAALR